MHSAWALKKKNSTNFSEEKDLLVKKVASTFVAPSSREFKGFESEHAASQTSDFCERKSKLGKKGTVFFYRGLRHKGVKKKENGK